MAHKGLGGTGRRYGMVAPTNKWTYNIHPPQVEDEIVKTIRTKKCNNCRYENNPIKNETCNYCGKNFGFTKVINTKDGYESNIPIEKEILDAMKDKRIQINKIENIHSIGHRMPDAKLITMTIYASD